MARTPVCFPQRVEFQFDFDTLTMKVVDNGELRAGAFVVMLVNTLDQIGLNQGEDYIWLKQNIYHTHYTVKFMTADGITLAKMLLAK